MYGGAVNERMRRVMRAVDPINAKLSRDAVRFAASGLKREWMTRCANRSPRYTTNWAELLTV